MIKLQLVLRVAEGGQVRRRCLDARRRWQRRGVGVVESAVKKAAGSIVARGLVTASAEYLRGGNRGDVADGDVLVQMEEAQVRSLPVREETV